MMRFRDLHPNLKVRFFESLLRNMLANTIHPFMSIFFAERFGLTMAGILLTANVLVGVLASLYGGPYSDRVGRRKIMLLTEYIRLFAFVIMAFSVSPWLDSAVLTYLMTFLMSLFTGFSQPAADAMLIDCSTDKSRPLVFSLGYWSWNVTILAGGLLGGFLFKTHLFEIFLVASAVSLISVIVLQFFIKETYFPSKAAALKQKSANLLASLAQYRQVLRDRVFLLFCLANLAFISVDTMAMRYAGVRLSAEMNEHTLFSINSFQFQIDGFKMYGLLWAENALLVVMVGLLAPRIIKRFAERKVLAAAVILSAAGFAVIAASGNPWLLMLMMAIATAGEMLGVPVTRTLLAKMVPDQSRSIYMATHGFTYQIRMMMGSLAITLGAFLTPWILGCLLLLIGAASIYLFMSVLRARSDSKITVQHPVDA